MADKYWVPCLYSCDDYVSGETGGVYTTEKLAVDKLIDMSMDHVYKCMGTINTQNKINLKKSIKDTESLIKHLKSEFPTYENYGIYGWSVSIKSFNVDK